MEHFLSYLDELPSQYKYESEINRRGKKLSPALLYAEHIHFTHVETNQLHPKYIPNWQKEKNYKKLLVESFVLDSFIRYDKISLLLTHNFDLSFLEKI